MSLEQASTSASREIPMWAAILYSDDDHEVADDTPKPIRLLPWHGRNIIWKFTRNILGQESQGIAGQACQMLERYLAAYLRGIPNEQLQGSEWANIKYDLKERMVLLVAVCIQLAIKMSSAKINVRVQHLQTNLLEYDKHFSVGEIMEAERKVYKGLGFRIPMWTNVEKAHLLAVELGMGHLLEQVTGVMDVVDYSRRALQEELMALALQAPTIYSSSDSEGGPSGQTIWLGNGKIRNIHLVAGAVAATSRFMQFSGPDPIPQLAFYTRGPIDYISCICTVIFNRLYSFLRDSRQSSDENNSSKITKKRRFQ